MSLLGPVVEGRSTRKSITEYDTMLHHVEGVLYASRCLHIWEAGTKLKSQS